MRVYFIQFILKGLITIIFTVTYIKVNIEMLISNSLY